VRRHLHQHAISHHQDGAGDEHQQQHPRAVAVAAECSGCQEDRAAAQAFEQRVARRVDREVGHRRMGAAEQPRGRLIEPGAARQRRQARHLEQPEKDEQGEAGDERQQRLALGIAHLEALARPHPGRDEDGKHAEDDGDGRPCPVAIGAHRQGSQRHDGEEQHRRRPVGEPAQRHQRMAPPGDPRIGVEGYFFLRYVSHLVSSSWAFGSSRTK
jgi:hypothetical protein